MASKAEELAVDHIARSGRLDYLALEKLYAQRKADFLAGFRAAVEEARRMATPVCCNRFECNGMSSIKWVTLADLEALLEEPKK